MLSLLLQRSEIVNFDHPLIRYFVWIHDAADTHRPAGNTHWSHIHITMHHGKMKIVPHAYTETCQLESIYQSQDRALFR